MLLRALTVMVWDPASSWGNWVDFSRCPPGETVAEVRTRCVPVCSLRMVTT